jgi:hypothetical protein
LRIASGPLVAGALAGRIEVDSREDKSELGGVGLDSDGLPVDAWELESACFEPLVPDDVAVAIPVEDFDAITPAVEEEEEMTRKGILAEVFADDGGERIEAFAQVDRGDMEEDPHGIWEADHDWDLELEGLSVARMGRSLAARS